MISKQDLYNNITNNKVYLNCSINDSKYIQSIGNIESKPNNDDIFDDICLEYIKNSNNNDNVNNDNDNNDNDNNLNVNNDNDNNVNYNNDNNINDNGNKILIEDIIVNNTKPIIKNIKNLNEYIDDSFINELSNMMMKDNRELRTELKDYVNNNLNYIKTLTKFYKKFLIDINNILVQTNIDYHINDNLLNIVVKLYNINILIKKNKIYKLYKINEDDVIYIFNKYSKNINNNKLINYRYDTKISLTDFNEIKEEEKYVEYIDEKVIKNMKVIELKELCKNKRINEKLKKNDLINELQKYYNKYN